MSRALKEQCQNVLRDKVRELLDAPLVRRSIERRDFIEATFVLQELFLSLGQKRSFDLAALSQSSMWLARAKSERSTIAINLDQVSDFIAEKMVACLSRLAGE